MEKMLPEKIFLATLAQMFKCYFDYHRKIGYSYETSNGMDFKASVKYLYTTYKVLLSVIQNTSNSARKSS